MKRLIILLVIACGCGNDDSEPTNNNIEVIMINGVDNALKVAVDVIYYWGERDGAKMEKGLTITTFSSPQAGDQTRVNGKVIELDREYVLHVGSITSQSLALYMSKQVGKAMFPNNLACINKINFDNSSEVANLPSPDDFVKSVVLNSPCPM
jgi:hypothetical protein